MIGSFDLDLKDRATKKYQKEFGRDNVLMIQRSSLFLWLKILFPLVGYIIIYISMVVAIAYAVDGNAETITYLTIIGLLLVFAFFALGHLKRFLDYLMDFIIVTPHQIISYNQTGIRKRSSMTIECSKIKSISTNFRGPVFSFANNGDINFLSEGDSTKKGEITALYVSNPKKIKEKIYAIIKVGNKKI